MPRAATAPSERSRNTLLLLASVTALLLLLTAVAGRAQNRDSVFELTPFFGYQVGDEFEVDDFDLGFVELEVADSEVLGVIVDIPISRSLQVEIFAAQQETDLEFAGTLFFPSERIGGVDLRVLHGGILYQGTLGQVKPYAVLTGGITNFDTEFAGSETYPSIALGGGVKLEFTDHFGLRLDGRFLFTDLDDERYDCCYDQRGDALTQFLGSAGLLLKF